MTRALCIGIVNLMPQAERYERMLLSAFEAARAQLPAAAPRVEPTWIRLTSHGYASSDEHHLRSYVEFAQAERMRLDGLIITGAPVEELPYADVRYWTELHELLRHARRHISSTLGLCWGGMALAKLLDIEKQRFERKLFGLYPLRAIATAGERNLSGEGAALYCAQSRHAGIDDALLEQAARDGQVRLLAHADRTGYSIFESADQRFVMHLGHPEYSVARLVYEYQRDKSAGRSDVDAPEGIHVDHPQESPAPHGPIFFARWLERVAGEVARREAAAKRS